MLNNILFNIVDNYEQCWQQNIAEPSYTAGSNFFYSYAFNMT